MTDATPPPLDLRICSSAHDLMREAARRFVRNARGSIDARGRFTVALAGGSTPKSLYTLLATPEVEREIDWSNVHVFWGDERCVAPDAAASNYRMAREALLDKVRIPHSQVHRIHGELNPERAASAYDDLLRRHFPRDEGPAGRLAETFDLVLLGLGADGHTASLFEASPALVEPSRWVQACYVSKLSEWRITLTPAVLNLARDVVFLVSGPDKAEAVRNVLAPSDTSEPPAEAIRPVRGQLHWFIDEPAAALLIRRV